MFEQTFKETSARSLEAKSLLKIIETRTLNPGLTMDMATRSLKGMMFIVLYGMVEFTLKRTMQEVIDHINASGDSVCDCKAVFWSVALNNKFDAISYSGRDSYWEKIVDMLEHSTKAVPLEFSTEVDPTMGRNVDFYQMQKVWQAFCVQAPVLPTMILKGTLDEVKSNRVKIAHGLSSPADIGRRFSSDDLKKRANDIESICLHILTSFEDYVVQKHYLK